MKKAVIALVLSLWASVASAQNVSTDFDAFAGATAAEALGVPGVTFSAAPAGVMDRWRSSVGFALMSGNVLYHESGAQCPHGGFRYPAQHVPVRLRDTSRRRPCR